MKIYLDNCTFNRPFDNQSGIRIRIETEAKLYIQEQIKAGKLNLVWSYILDFENEQSPFIERKISISKWKKFAVSDVEESETLLKTANSLQKSGLKSKDALHLASAIEANAEYFITTDDGILKKTSKFDKILVVNPTDFIKKLKDYDN